MTPGISSLLWFLAILAMIPVALWLLKRSPAIGGATRGLMSPIATLPLSPNQKLVTVEVGTGAEKRWLVLGVTAQSITTLHTMAPQEGVLPAGAAGQAPASFSQLLGRFQRKEDGGAH